MKWQRRNKEQKCDEFEEEECFDDGGDGGEKDLDSQDEYFESSQQSDK